jgi:hypothetical protein
MCVLLILGTPAAAAEWWLVSSSGDKPDRTIEFMDKESAVSDFPGQISVWTFKIKEKLQKDGVRKSKILHRYNCNKRTMALVQMIEFGNNDRLVYSNTWKSYEQTEDSIVPESVGESKWTFACRGKSTLDTAISVSPEQYAAAYFNYVD